MIGDNYNRVLASYIFNRLVNIQTDDHRIRHQPKLWPTGFLFTPNDIENAIEEVNSDSLRARATWQGKIRHTEADVKEAVKKEDKRKETKECVREEDKHST